MSGRGSHRHTRARVATALALAVGCLTGLGARPAAADTPPTVGARVGVVASSTLLWEDDVARQADLDAIAATGARWTGVDIDWNSIQDAGPFEYDWSVTDRVVREANARGLHIIGTLAYAPAWARPESCPAGTSHCLPELAEDFARFAKSAALRYGAHAFDPRLRGTIETWQVWNEPNHYPFVQPTVDVARYATLLQRAYAEINKVDETTTVLAAGTAPAPDDPKGRDMAPVTFLEGLYANGAGDSFDAFAHHPYSYPCNPLTNEQWNAFFQTYWLHQVLVRHGDGDRKIWGTEAGSPTGADVGTCGRHDGVSLTEAGQADAAVDYLRGWTQTFGRFTGPLLWYQIRDAGTGRTDPHDHFGLVRRDFSAKPAFDSFRTFLARPDLGIAPVGSPAPDPGPDPGPSPEPTPSPDPAPDPLPGPLPGPDPTPIPEPGPSECLDQDAPVPVRGAQTDRFAPDVSAPTAIDARGASWTQVDPWPVSVTGSGSLCWNGGTIAGTYGLSTVWETFHHTGGFSFNNPGSVIEDVRVHNYGDAINVRDGAANWTVRGAHTSFIHDDCLQDDYLNAGVIEDSLFDGCYVGISTRPSSGTTGVDGHTLTLTLRGSLLRLQPMPTVYKGPAPGTGGFFKWDDAGRSPKLALFDNVFRVDQEPNHGTLGLPDVPVSCGNNTIVWLGGGAFPEAASWLAKCPDTKIVTTRATWDGAVTTWTSSR